MSPTIPGSTDQSVGPFPRKLGQYILHRWLAQGGMGTVYLATHINLKTPVALKTLRANQLENPDALARFYREMAAIGGLVHPHIVRALDAGKIEETHYLAMEYLVGSTLARIVEERKTLSVPDACEAIRQAANGLAAIHKAGLVHRDLKPSNLLLTADGTVKILDLGLARLMSETSDATNDPELTPTGTTLGTLDYLAPEQIQKARRVDIRADIYSLGCTLYKLLCGHAPYARPEYDSVPKKLLAHYQEPLPQPLSASITIPSELWNVLLRMTAKDAELRYQTPLELESALRLFANCHNLSAMREEQRFVEELREISELSSGRISSANVDTLIISTPPPLNEADSSQTEREHTRIAQKKKRFLFAGILGGALLLTVAYAVWNSSGALDETVTQSNVNPVQSPDEEDLLEQPDVVPEQEMTLTPVPQKGNVELVENPEPGNQPPIVPIEPERIAQAAPLGFLKLPIPNFDGEVPLQWHRLLQKPPFQLVWVDPEGLSAVDYQEQRQQVIVRSEGISLFLLGETLKEDYQLQIGISQSEWEDGVGVFLGLHPATAPDQTPLWEFQLLQVDHDGLQVGGFGFSVSRRKSELPQDIQEVSEFRNRGFMSEQIPSSLSGEMMIEILVRRGELRRVKFEDRELTQLVAPQIQTQFPKEFHLGGFGIFNIGNDSLFRNAQVKILNPE